MCDTLYKKTKNGFLFAKNSDRSPNEPNLSLRVEAMDHSEKKVSLTYIEIEQVRHTYAMMLIRPSWTWGAEMGVNEFGLFLGNEAVFTKSKNKKEPSIIGMDYVRLALERAKDSQEAIQVITSLLEKHGQGGNCGFDKAFFYDNSYLIADHNEAWILETAGKSWVASKIDEVGNISNRLSIQDHHELQNVDPESNFMKQHIEPVFSHFSCSFERKFQASVGLLSMQEDALSLRQLMQSHHPKDEHSLFTKGSLHSLCMHYSVLGDHTTSSMVAEVDEEFILLWLTSASTPCLSLYKPCFFDDYEGIIFQEEQDSLAYWMRQEKIHRLIYAGNIQESLYRQELLLAQSRIDALVEHEKKLGFPNRAQLVRDALSIEEEFLSQFEKKDVTISELGPKRWHKKNQSLGKDVFAKDWQNHQS